MKLDLVFIGSGNVAWHLAHAMDRAGHTVSQVISRNEKHAEKLASRLGSQFGNDLSQTYVNCDICLICVSDDEIESVVSSLPYLNAGLVHTCGPKSMEILSSKSGQIGVFYPLQSFAKERKVDMFNVPVMLESASYDLSKKLYSLADSISNKVMEVKGEDRLKYHLAAVFANNFTNYLYSEAEQYLVANDLDFSILHPIILETASRIQELSPAQLQTGPAKRGDEITIERHLELLNGHQQLKGLYEILTAGIRSRKSE